EDPALVAWSAALSGAPLDEDLAARLLRAQSPSGQLDGALPVLSTACAMLAWSSADEHDQDAAAALARAIQALSPSGVPAQDAAALAALAASGVQGAGGAM